MEKRIKEEFKVRKLEFYMGDNDIVDMRCGGPARLAFWVFSSLPEKALREIADSAEIQQVVKQHGGDGYFSINSAWAEKYCETEDATKNQIMKLVKQF